MAAIWNDIQIEWQGETYTVKPTMDLINKLEQGEGMSLASMLVRLSKRDLPSSVACELIARTLRYAGASVTSEDVYMATTGGLDADAINMAGTILEAVLPSSGAPEPPKEGQKKAKS